MPSARRAYLFGFPQPPQVELRACRKSDDLNAVGQTRKASTVSPLARGRKASEAQHSTVIVHVLHDRGRARQRRTQD